MNCSGNKTRGQPSASASTYTYPKYFVAIISRAHLGSLLACRRSGLGKPETHWGVMLKQLVTVRAYIEQTGEKIKKKRKRGGGEGGSSVLLLR